MIHMIGGIIFARTTSSRLPSKVLLEVQNKTILSHIVDRVKNSKFVDKIIIATSTNKNDDIIEKIAFSLGVECFRGSEDDVLDRCYHTAKKFSLDAIVRITGDDPIKDPLLIDRGITIYKQNNDKFDLVCNTMKPTFPEGLDVEIISFSILEQIWRNSVEPAQREHLTKYIFDNQSDFRIFNFEHSENLSQIRLTLDTKEDFELIKRIYDALYPSDNCFSWIKVLSYLKSNPHLLEINKDIKKSGRYLT